jgi:trk system potassium uptake protein TrkH
MDWSDAFMHMCSTVSLGGFSSHDLSFGYWNSPRVEAVAVTFMLLAGVNFALYFVAWRQRSFRLLWRDIEWRAFAVVLIVSVALIVLVVLASDRQAGFEQTLRRTVFHVVSVATTTG